MDNYLKKLILMDYIPGGYIAHIWHDDNCQIFRGGRCNCDPDITLEKIEDIIGKERH